MARLQRALRNARRFVVTSSDKRNTIARARFARNIWICCGAAAWNLMSVMSDFGAPAGAAGVFMIRHQVVCTAG